MVPESLFDSLFVSDFVSDFDSEVDVDVDSDEPDVAFDDERLQIGARGVESGGQARRAGADDQDVTGRRHR